MTIGNALLKQDIALLSQEETEEALLLMRYFLYKEKSPAGRRNYAIFIGQLEKKLGRWELGGLPPQEPERR
jgi:hypothetical protein